LENVKALAHRHGALLVFDEVSCGWRLRIGGVQTYTGVTPDMTVIAKAMSNGYPMGAVVGSVEAMEPAGRMFISSSYWSDNIGLAAAITTIRELKRRDSERRFEEIGEKLRRALDGALKNAGLSGACKGLYVNPYVSIDLPDPKLSAKVSTLFIQEMAKRGIHTYMAFKATLAHIDEDIRVTAKAAEEAFSIIKTGLESGTVDRFLECEVKREPFRRQVR